MPWFNGIIPFLVRIPLQKASHGSKKAAFSDGKHNSGQTVHPQESAMDDRPFDNAVKPVYAFCRGLKPLTGLRGMPSMFSLPYQVVCYRVYNFEGKRSTVQSQKRFSSGKKKPG